VVLAVRSNRCVDVAEVWVSFVASMRDLSMSVPFQRWWTLVHQWADREEAYYPDSTAFAIDFLTELCAG
jgi:hypothetical protein